MKKYEKKVIEFICNNYIIFGFIIVSLFALIIRLLLFPYESKDYTIHLSSWFNYMKTQGGIFALDNYEGNYNAPYMTIMALLTYIPVKGLYLIKLVSVLFDFGLALSSAALVRYLVKKDKTFIFFLTYSIILFTPEIVFNSAVWAQCDSGYTMFIVLAILYLLKEKYLKSFIFLGGAFALKLQFIFILPLFVIYYFVKKRFTILYFLIIPAVNFVLCLPAIIIGLPIKDILLVYFKQTTEYKNYINLNFINIYGLVPPGNGTILHYFGIISTVFVCFIMLIYIIHKNIKLDNKKIVNLGLWFSVITTYLLTSMHDRYLYLGCVLVIIYYIVYRENFLLLLSIIICSILTYFSFLFGTIINSKEIVIIAYSIVLAYYTKDLIRKLDDKV